MTRPSDLSWLPNHQHHVMYTLAHAQRHIANVADILLDYTKRGAYELPNVADGDQVHVTIARVAPLAPGVARYIADALTQLRAAVEHTLFAEVEHQLGRALTSDEERRVEMPAATESAKFTEWLRRNRRPELAPL